MNERRFEIAVSFVLIAGVAASAFLMVIGFLASFLVGWGGSLTGAPPQPSDPTSFAGLADGLRDLRPIAIAQLGLVLLILTPVARVAIAVVGFALERDRVYVAIAVTVLGVLLMSLLAVR
jgi:uncharacterized membrane protein